MRQVPAILSYTSYHPSQWPQLIALGLSLNGGLISSSPCLSKKGQNKFAIVAVDYFTKWAEAEPLARITENQTTKFIWRNIICRYGLPHTIITDNGKQFDNAAFDGFCEKWKICNIRTSPYHPQANGQVEAVNKIIKHHLKTKLDECKGMWPELLPEVLWAYRTTIRTSTGETPFSLAFGIDTVVPVEIQVPSYRIEQYDSTSNQEGLRLHLDLLEERRDASQMRAAAYQQRIARYPVSYTHLTLPTKA